MYGAVLVALAKGGAVVSDGRNAGQHVSRREHAMQHGVFMRAILLRPQLTASMCACPAWLWEPSFQMQACVLFAIH